jgi:geranylgeranyl reductase family protein
MIIMEKYDVIIIGAGPAGLNCAQTLANSNKKVLLIEQNKIIGPKVCAGLFTNNLINYMKMPEKLIDKKSKKIILHTPTHKDLVKSKKYFIYTLDRKNLGQWQLKKLKKTKTTIKTNTRVTKITKKYIEINNKEKIKYKYLVGADGATSTVRRFLKIKNDEIGIGIQYIIPTKNFKNFEAFLDSDIFHSWYAWILPHKNYVSIGCGADPKFISSKDLMKNFNKWLKKNKIDITKAKYEAFPINYDYQGHKFKNTFLIGDAAGLVSGITGEGIYPALISGEEIAKIIMNKKYKPEKLEEILKKQRFHKKILRFLERSGPLRKIEYELLLLLLKNKIFEEKLIHLLET